MPLTTADKLQIQELGARYNHAIDYGHPEAWADCFTPDGCFISPQGQQDGRDALIAFAAASAASALSARHWTNNWVIAGSGDDATATCYLNLINAHNAGASIVTGLYRDRLRRVDGVWKFTERNVATDLSAEELQAALDAAR
jgi:uncharacterized protein (TIGR02246 family)